jgi:hypothetical protein
VACERENRGDRLIEARQIEKEKSVKPEIGEGGVEYSPIIKRVSITLVDKLTDFPSGVADRGATRNMGV